jgi:hypothetical protein
MIGGIELAVAVAVAHSRLAAIRPVARTGAFVSAASPSGSRCRIGRAGQAAVEAALPIEKEFQRITRRAIQNDHSLATL